MTIDNDQDLQGLLRIGQICGLTLQHMLAHAEPGMTTEQLDDIGAAFLKQHGARSAPILAYRYPGYTCLSLNDEVAHGIPGKRVIGERDLLNIDVSAELEGYWADTGASVVMPPGDPARERLVRTTREALAAGIEAARDGQPLRGIGRAVEGVARRGGYRVIRALTGHGVGRHIHEKPTVFNYDNKEDPTVLAQGMVITIEPFLSVGNGRIYTDEDGWTLRSVDGSVAAQCEHTVIITNGAPILATAVA